MSHRNIFYYDSRDNLTCVRDPDLGLTYYTYDAGSRMTSVKNPFGEVTYYDYRPDGQMVRRVLGNGCVTYYEFDAIGRTTKVDNRDGDMSVVSSFAYERDEVGNPLSIEREDGYTVYYEYDGKHQLIAETHVDGGETVYAWEWDYDAAGNREFQVFNGEATYYEYKAANELLTETTGGETTYYEYDACGNTTVKQEPTGTTYYHWDHENLMTRLDLPDGGHTYFAYDADSKRVSKRDSDGFTEFIYQGPDMLALQMEWDEAESTRVRYTMGSGLEAMRRANGGDIASGDSSFYHFDWLGSTSELTDESETVTDTYLYNAWGQVLERTGTTHNPHSYEGRSRYYSQHGPAPTLLGVRYLLIKMGRFLTIDPDRSDSLSGSTSLLHEIIMTALLLPAEGRSVVALDENGYRYSINRPSVLIDPEGLWCMDAVHLKKTFQWAPAVRARRSGRTYRPTQAEAFAMAVNSRKVDVDHPSYPHRISDMKWHFNWMYGPDERQQLASDLKAEAIQLGKLRSLCILSAMKLGTGLHPLQDIESHGNATPYEHVLYWRKMDNPAWDRLRTGPRVIPVPRAALLWNYWHPFANRITWQRGSQRIADTEQATKSYIADWLSHTCCGTTRSP
ncbi:MAG: hypothetical protein U9R79_09390 [Armatimonadota bacterium]|nr:hypothetical protein [Armatimonadota bacterium]